MCIDQTLRKMYIIPSLVICLTSKLSVGGVDIVAYSGSLFEPRTVDQCDRLSDSYSLDIVHNLSECSLLCHEQECRRFLYCDDRRLCVAGSNLISSVNSTGCVCLAKLRVCQNGGTVLPNDTCSCLPGYYGVQCEHVIRDCGDGFDRGLGKDQDLPSWIKPPGATRPFEVTCDYYFGYTFLLKRPVLEATGDFFKSWAEYESGFGVLGSEHWLGLNKMHLLTSEGTYQLDVNLNAYRDWGQGFYCPFKVDGPETNYTLHLGDFQSPNPNGLGDAFQETGGRNISGKPFSTYDHDTIETGCPQKMHSGFWFDVNCTSGNVNGPYVSQPDLDNNQEIARVSWGLPFRNDRIRDLLMRVKRVDYC